MDVIAHALAGALTARCFAPAGASPSVAAAVTVVGALAGVAPDLDALVEVRGKLAGWRYHRVALHGVAPAAALALPVVLVALLTPAGSLGFWRLAGAALAAIATHLVLDVVTSFGTALGFPFAPARFTTRTHFIVDPVVLALLGAGLYVGRHALALAAVGAYLVAAVAIRAWLTARARRALAAFGYEGVTPVLEPRFLAPWRWLVIVDLGPRYLLGAATPLGFGRWLHVASGRDDAAAAIARRDPLLRAFLATCDFPRFRWSKRGDGRWLVVEDIKWWLELPFRPLAFSARVDAEGVPEPPRQTKLWDVGPTGVLERATLLSLPPLSSARRGRGHDAAG